MAINEQTKDNKETEFHYSLMLLLIDWTMTWGMDYRRENSVVKYRTCHVLLTSIYLSPLKSSPHIESIYMNTPCLSYVLYILSNYDLILSRFVYRSFLFDALTIS